MNHNSANTPGLETEFNKLQQMLASLTAEDRSSGENEHKDLAVQIDKQVEIIKQLYHQRINLLTKQGEELQRMSAMIEREKREWEVTSAALGQMRKVNDELETRVRDRTQELIQANQDLQKEIQTRESVQANLASEKELLSVTLLSIRDGVISTDKNGVVVLLNKAAEDITGYHYDEMVGKPFNQTITLWDDRLDQPIQDALHEMLESSKFGPLYHLVLVTKDGKRLLVSSSGAPVKNPDGELMGYVLIFTNITERAKQEAQFALSQKMESIGRLAAGIAHEINTPMQYIGDNTHFLNDSFDVIKNLLVDYEELLLNISDPELQEKHRQWVKELRKKADYDYYAAEIPSAIRQSLEGIDRVRKIVLALKSFSHPSIKEKQPSNINEGIETTATISRNEWKYVADLELNLQPDLPLVHCVIDEINQVILNMVINSAQAIQEVARDTPGYRGKIKIKTALKEDRVAIIIQDTGGGIPVEILDRIFDPFFTTKEVGKGTGQGLALAHDIIVNKHNGDIHVESKIGYGTTFTVELPIYDASRDQEDV